MLCCSGKASPQTMRVATLPRFWHAPQLESKGTIQRLARAPRCVRAGASAPGAPLAALEGVEVPVHALDWDRGTHQQWQENEADVELTLQVVYPSSLGERLLVSGSTRALGEWVLERAVPLEWGEGNTWRSPSLPAEPGTAVEYKYILLHGDEVVWSSGKNLSLRVPSNVQAGRVGVEDFWDHPEMHEQHVDAGRGLPQPIPLQCFDCGDCLMPHLWCKSCPKAAA